VHFSWLGKKINYLIGGPEMLKGAKGAVVLCVAACLLVFPCVGCSGKSQMTAPGIEASEGSESCELGMFRNLLWTNPPAGDELIPDDASGEKNVDITNVVYDHFYPPDYPGRIKDHWPGGGFYPQEDEYTYTVAAWQVPEGNISNIYFRVLYRDGDGNYDRSPEMINNPLALVQTWPAITANLRFDGRMVVDIAFQARQGLDPGQKWAIWHTRYIQDTPQDFSSFSPDPNFIMPMLVFALPDSHCIHPDIVLDAAPDAIHPLTSNRLHLVFEINNGYQEGSRIYYIKGEDLVLGGVNWGVEQGCLSILSPAPYNERPRIDVGWDDSDIVTALFGVPSIYYVGVVWSTMEFDGDISSANIAYCGIWAEFFVPSEPNVIFLSDAGPYNYHVFPHIEIDPVELALNEPLPSPRFTHVVWTETLDSDPPHGDYQNAYMWGQYSARIMEYGILSPRPLYEGSVPGGRNGLPILGTFTREVWDQESQWSERAGWLTWLHDEGPEDPNVEVWAGRIEYNDDYPYHYYSVNQEHIGGGDSSIYSPFVYGPEVCIFNEIIGRSIWTNFDAGSPDSVLGDCSEW
jgi:hypothetical protein